MGTKQTVPEPAYALVSRRENHPGVVYIRANCPHVYHLKHGCCGAWTPIEDDPRSMRLCVVCEYLQSHFPHQLSGQAR